MLLNINKLIKFNKRGEYEGGIFFFSSSFSSLKIVIEIIGKKCYNTNLEKDK